ncbi:MAG: sodium/solute symporter [Candidatus Hydrogenedentes bacterium]|nr:sodium/solute symporter [Candidatus Hydrogenedentota bacterium]
MHSWTFIDGAVMVAYILAIVSFGSMFARRQRTATDFFLANRRFKWLPIALSVIASDLSAISYLGAPAMSFQHDLRYALTILILPVAVLIAVYTVVQVFYRLQVFTVYEYLENRFHVSIRMLAALLFLLVRGGWLATVIYTPALALSVVSGANLTFCILITGILTTLYTMLGGIEAVIWCDVIHFCVLTFGIVVALTFILYDFGGSVTDIWAIASAHGRTRMVSFDWRWSAEFTVWGIIAMSLVNNLSSYGVDQVVVQRYFTAKSMKDLVKSAVGQSLLVIPVTLALYLVGTGLFAYYQQHPEMMKSLLNLDPANPVQATNRVFPHFITFGLPAGISGLVIAGIVAATMGSFSSGLNSVTTVVVMDFYKRFFHREAKTEAHYLRAGRVATLFLGFTATGVAFFVGHLGTILEMTGKISSFLVGPIVAMFLLGVLSKRANTPGVFVGTLCGLGAVAWWSSSVFWLWWGLLGLVVSAAVGYALSVNWNLIAGKPGEKRVEP